METSKDDQTQKKATRPNVESEVFTRKEPKMELECKSCHAAFESTFSVSEFSQVMQYTEESGTLHLCPSCGNLSVYLLADYREPA